MAEKRAYSGEEGERGFALILAIWVLSLLAVIALATAADTRSTLAMTRNRSSGAEAKALAEAGIWWAVERLVDDQPAKSLRTDGTPYRISVAGHSVQVEIEEESGKVDINEAPAELLAGLLRSAGSGAREAGGLAGSIADYRARKLAQAKQDSGTAAAATDPRAFRAIEELRLVPGIDSERYARLAPFITAESGDRRINPERAPRTVLLALPGVDPLFIDHYLRQRAEGSPAREEFATADDAARYIAWRDSGIVTLRATSRQGGTTYIQEALVELTGKADRPYRIDAWREGIAAAE